ncbi:MAG: oligosaccharide flippase family protein, partial [Deltaproteobacteria bacterium]|nr:oligosaccharide flippase family protein [Deltaproteobacteria bacterium]
WEYFALAFAGALLAQILNQSAEVFRLLYRARDYVLVTLGQSVLSAVVALVLIIWWHSGVLGFFWGALAGALVAGAIGWWRIRAYLTWTGCSPDWWPRLLRFGGPLVPEGMILYLLHTADRWFVGHYNGPAQLGLYAVGAKFALVVSLVVTTFRQAWWPVAMEAMHHPEEAELFKIVARFYLGMGAAAVVMPTALSPKLMWWLAAPEYFASYPLVVVLSWSPVFYGFYLITGLGIWKAAKTAWSPLILAMAAGVNVGLDLWLVPRFGGLGAAGATSVSFLIWNALALGVSRRLWPINFSFGIMVFQTVIGGLATAVILVFHARGGPEWLIFFMAIFVSLTLIVTSAGLKHWKQVWPALVGDHNGVSL